jgi:hypothetical protein
MVTQQNMFVRKFGDMAILITVTDWDDYKELERFSQHESPDLLVSSTTTKTIISSMCPLIQVNTFEANDITDKTKGMGIAGIMTESRIWGYKKIGGPSVLSEMYMPK